MGGAMRARLRYEHEAIQLLEREGYQCIRSAGSRGPMDLIAFGHDRVLLVQVKSTKRLLHPGTVSMLADAVQALLQTTRPPLAEPWIYLRELQGGWLRECVDGYPTQRRELKVWLRKLIHRWRDG